MYDTPDEKDWKAFRKLVPILRDRYLGVRNEELAAMLDDDERSATEKFWDLEERVGEVAVALRACLDGHTRSKMKLFMMKMLGEGMMTVEDLDGFSDDLRASLTEWTKLEL